MSMMLAERGEGKKDDSKSPPPATECHLLLFPGKGHPCTRHSYGILGESFSWAWTWVFRTPDRGSGLGVSVVYAAFFQFLVVKLSFFPVEPVSMREKLTQSESFKAG